MGGTCCSKDEVAATDSIDTSRKAETGRDPLKDSLIKDNEQQHQGTTDTLMSPPEIDKSKSMVTMGTDVMSAGSPAGSPAPADTELDELHLVRATELGQFVIKKMNNKTLDRLWKHLDEDNSGQIERTEVLNILQWMSVLYVAFRFRQQGGQGQPQINKRKLKAQFVPVKDWILENKMNTKNVVTREEFRKTFGAWLKEYGEVN